MTATFDEKTFRRLFRVSLFLKAAFSLSEIVGGVLAYFISQRYLLHLVTTFTQEQLTEDPRDFVAHFLIQSAQQMSVSAQHFAAFRQVSVGSREMIYQAPVTGCSRSGALPVVLHQYV